MRKLSDAIEFGRLRRRLPNAHRAWSTASGKLRPETDAEYLARLRALAHEREHLRKAKAAARGTTAAPQRATEDVGSSGHIGRIAKDLRDALEAAEGLVSATIEPTFIEGAIDQARLLLVRLMESQRPQTNGDIATDQGRWIVAHASAS